MGGCFPYAVVVVSGLGLVDGGAVPVVGVDVEGCEDPGLECGAAGDERDRAAVGVEDNGADPVEFS